MTTIYLKLPHSKFQSPNSTSNVSDSCTQLYIVWTAETQASISRQLAMSTVLYLSPGSTLLHCFLFLSDLKGGSDRKGLCWDEKSERICTLNEYRRSCSRKQHPEGSTPRIDAGICCCGSSMSDTLLYWACCQEAGLKVSFSRGKTWFWEAYHYQGHIAVETKCLGPSTYIGLRPAGRAGLSLGLHILFFHRFHHLNYCPSAGPMSRRNNTERGGSWILGWGIAWILATIILQVFMAYS